MAVQVGAPLAGQTDPWGQRLDAGVGVTWLALQVEVAVPPARQNRPT